MFGSTVLEVAIGLSFCYASVSLTVSTIQEAIASALRLRASTLLNGIKTMFNDPAFTGLALALYRHALVNPHDDGMAVDPHAVHKKPSYISPQHFAIALVDVIHTVPGDFVQLGRDIAALADPQVRSALAALYDRANGDMRVFQAGVAGWFDSAMERVSGAYKRRATMISVLLSFTLAALFNIDSIHLFRTLWQHPAIAAATTDPRALDALWILPIGWQAFPPALDAGFLVQLAGWLLTASSALFGSPFWFDLLQRLVHVRGTGAKPR